MTWRMTSIAGSLSDGLLGLARRRGCIKNTEFAKEKCLPDATGFLPALTPKYRVFSQVLVHARTTLQSGCGCRKLLRCNSSVGFLDRAG
jgi:hypothetical protein